MTKSFIERELSRVSPQEVMGVIRRTLCLMDERLVEHGERVAYLLYRMLSFGGRLRDYDWEKLMLLSVFHDIGAYKTDEIDNMLAFETEHYYDHSVYGYLFLKLLTPLGESAEAVLYHHTSYERLQEVDSPYRAYAELIHLADRADICHRAGMDCEAVLGRGRGTAYAPELVDLFLKAEREAGILEACDRMEHLSLLENSGALFSGEQLFDFLQMIVFSIDFRSSFTVSHTISATAISVSIAKLAGLSPREVRSIGYGAFLHDLGKIAIPVEILESPGRLSPSEMRVMKTHVEITEKIIRGVVSDEVCEIAVRHHEKLDGSGYPRGLSGGDLTYPQRILAVADIISALSGRRSYKESLPKEEVVGILRDMEAYGKLSSRACEVVYSHYDEIMGSADRILKPVKELYETLSREYQEIRLASLRPG